MSTNTTPSIVISSPDVDDTTFEGRKLLNAWRPKVGDTVYRDTDHPADDGRRNSRRSVSVPVKVTAVTKVNFTVEGGRKYKLAHGKSHSWHATTNYQDNKLIWNAWAWGNPSSPDHVTNRPRHGVMTLDEVKAIERAKVESAQAAVDQKRQALLKEKGPRGYLSHILQSENSYSRRDDLRWFRQNVGKDFDVDDAILEAALDLGSKLASLRKQIRSIGEQLSWLAPSLEEK